MALDTNQLAAVKHYRGPAMILAGPGSGKTTVITHRIWNLIEEYSVPPEEILVITFTKAAATEMKNRFLKMKEFNGTEVTFGTFHSVFFMILKSAYNYKAEDIIKVKEQQAFIRTMLRIENVTVSDEDSFVSDVLSEIAKVKSLGCWDSQYEPISCESGLFFRLFGEYQNMLLSAHRIDFEDMLIKTWELFNSRNDLLLFWQKRYKYILVDEFQDSSPLQFDIVRLLADRYKNIFIVGDDDQSIYGFRGAAPGVMQDFMKLYDKADIYKLNINYRSAANIVTSATALINNNKNRFYKDLRAFNQHKANIEIISFSDVSQEYEYIAKSISTNPESTAVLTRTNTAGLELIKKLTDKGFNVKSAAKGSTLYEHWIAKDITSYVRLAIGKRERADYLRVLNKPERYISRSFFTRQTVDCDEVISCVKAAGNDELLVQVCGFFDDILILGRLTPFAGINYIRKKIGYDNYIKDYAVLQGADIDKLNDVLNQLTESMRGFSSYRQWLEHIEVHSEPEVKEDNRSQGSSCITFSTMHASKGLEFDNVYIIDVNEGVMPYAKAVFESEQEEERRLFYVAMTRAKKKLVISSVEKRHNKTLQPSRYIKELQGGL